MNKTRRYGRDVRERAVRFLFTHEQRHASQWSALTSIPKKISCAPETLSSWLKRVERDGRCRPGLTTEERAQLTALERQRRELRLANEILRKASAYFARAGLDRRGG